MIILHFDLQPRFKYMNYFICTSHQQKFYIQVNYPWQGEGKNTKGEKEARLRRKRQLQNDQICEFCKKRNCTPRSGSCNFSFLKNSLVQSNSKLNSKPYDYLYKSGHLWSRATAVKFSREIVNCFPFDVIAFAMLPAHGIWLETVSLLNVMWPWTSQWMGAL